MLIRYLAMVILEPKLPAQCDTCGQQVPFIRLKGDRDTYGRLVDDYYWRKLTAELRILRAVADFYSRNPQAEGQVVPHWMRVLRSSDPRVRAQLAPGVDPDEIELPPLEAVLQLDLSGPMDAEVMEHLSHCTFELDGRTRFVEEKLEALAPRIREVPCDRCPAGRWHLMEQLPDPGVRGGAAAK